MPGVSEIWPIGRDYSWYGISKKPSLFARMSAHAVVTAPSQYRWIARSDLDLDAFRILYRNDCIVPGQADCGPFVMPILYPAVRTRTLHFSVIHPLGSHQDRPDRRDVPPRRGSYLVSCHPSAQGTTRDDPAAAPRSSETFVPARPARVRPWRCESGWLPADAPPGSGQQRATHCSNC